MVLDKKGLALIKTFEGFKAKPYICPAGIPTIGYGTTRYEGGRHVTMKDAPISEERASDILKHQVDSHYGAAVDRYVQIDINQNQFDALVSFAYNLGIGALKSSTLLQKVNRGRSPADEFGKWIHANGKILSGLVRRREAERNLYLA